jgi:hypothetical protein
LQSNTKSADVGNNNNIIHAPSTQFPPQKNHKQKAKVYGPHDDDGDAYKLLHKRASKTQME